MHRVPEEEIMATEKKVELAKVKKAAPAKATASVKIDALKTDIKDDVKVEAPKAVEAKKAETKTVAKKAAAKPAAKKAPAKKAAAKPAAKKATAKKTSEKATLAAKAAEAKKANPKCAYTVQFGEKSYTTDDFAKMASDVWVYDYDKKASELKTVQMYVKPEESKVYYVFNDKITGSFDI